jgi:hypothetical protein
MRRALLFLAAVAAVALGGCSADGRDSAGGNGPDAKTRRAMLAFAQCMREHGVDMPDPHFDGNGGVTMRRNSSGSPEKDRAAEKACARYQRAVKPPELSDEEKAEFRKQALANARCLRAHGIDAPDPVFGEDGSVQMRIGGKGERPDEDKLRLAQKACRKTMPGITREDK